MIFTLPQLPYEMDALVPFLSQETLEYHYGKHHQGYVNKLNELIKGTQFEHQSLENIIQTSDGAIFNNAAQVWNHTFYWNCLSPLKNTEPSRVLLKAINQVFGSFERFQAKFAEAAISLFGSGWVWLVQDPDRFTLEIVAASNAQNPITNHQIPLLTCDVWEHAYYIDYRNQRAAYVGQFWNFIDWGFVNSRFIVK